MALTNGGTKGFVIIWVDVILQYFPNIPFYFPTNIPRFVSSFTYLSAATIKVLLVFWDTTEDALRVDSCLYFRELNCKHFTLFFPAVSIADNEFSTEIIQLQLPKCLILSCILILVCLLQPCQEMDVAALAFVQIIKKVHKYFSLVHWNRTLKCKLNWLEQKIFLINVILLMILCRFMESAAVHRTEELFDWMKTQEHIPFCPLTLGSSGTVRARVVFWVRSTFQRIFFFFPVGLFSPPLSLWNSKARTTFLGQEFQQLNCVLYAEPFSFIRSCCLLPLEGLNIYIGRCS